MENTAWSEGAAPLSGLDFIQELYIFLIFVPIARLFIFDEIARQPRVTVINDRFAADQNIPDLMHLQ
jgi:hypothetical protein